MRETTRIGDLNIEISSPCSVSWESMTGDERKRFCGKCKLNVYNLSNFNDEWEARNFLLSQSTGGCATLYRRKTHLGDARRIAI